MSNTIEIELKRISDMLDKTLKIYEEDRCLAKAQYDTLKEQLDDIYEAGLPMSEEGALEKETNRALRNYIDSGRRLEKVVEIVTKMFNKQMDNNTKLLIADKFTGGGNALNAPADFRKLLSKDDD